jgi:hypothetical protein
LLSGCHGDEVDEALETELATASSEVLRGPRGGMGFSRGIDCASAKPDQAITASEQKIPVQTDVLDSIVEAPCFVIGTPSEHNPAPDRNQRKQVKSPSGGKAAQTLLARWQLEPFGCLIGSALGCIELGRCKQLEIIREELSAQVPIPAMIVNLPAAERS